MEPAKPSLNDLRIERRERPVSARRVWYVVAGLIVLVVLLLLFWQKTSPELLVQTAVARAVSSSTGSDRTVLNASGYVTARREATVSSKVTGKVVEVMIEEGMKVKEGQILARLDDTNIKASLSLAEAQLAAAKAGLEETRVRIKEADQNLRRISALAKSSISAQAELDRAEAEAASLKARLQQQSTQVTVAEREVASWQQQLDDTVIRAPFAGVVTSKNAQPGEMISPISAGGGFTRTGICTIVDMDSLEIEIDVSESYINRVQPGQPVMAALDAYADWKIPCKVIAIIPTADRQKSTVRVRVGFDRLDPRILPQMSVKVGFQEPGASPVSPTREVLIPQNAVRQQAGTNVVMVAHAGRAELRPVTLGRGDGKEVAVVSGMVPGEKVILDWPPALAAGVRVREAGTEKAGAGSRN